MELALASTPTGDVGIEGSPAAPVLEIVVPVFNEEEQLERGVLRLHEYLRSFPFSSRITIADNASTDGTWQVARRLSAELDRVECVRLDRKGRGRALHHVWSRSDADVLAYMDVDLSTDLAALLPLVAPLVSGHSDLAIGSRLTGGANVVRGPKREFISRTYNRILHTALATRFTDAQCGFKAIRADRARQLLPLVKDRAWFFDTELLVLAERAGFRIHEIPVDWVDDPDSRVDIVSTAVEDLRGVWRLLRDLRGGRLDLPQRPLVHAPSFVGQAVRFGLIGLASTIAYILLYLVLRNGVGSQAANAGALLLTAVANTAANRRYTFGIRGSARVVKHQTEGLAVFGLALAVTSGSLALLHALAPDASRSVELTVLVAANLVATVLRFVLLRGWVFRERRSPPALEESA